jgi:hypothetical protein
MDYGGVWVMTGMGYDRFDCIPFDVVFCCFLPPTLNPAFSYTCRHRTRLW